MLPVPLEVRRAVGGVRRVVEREVDAAVVRVAAVAVRTVIAVVDSDGVVERVADRLVERVGVRVYDYLADEGSDGAPSLAVSWLMRGIL